MIVKIKKLFGYRNYDLDFRKKANVLIGENGSGKSTIIEMITHLLNQDYSDLSKIPFEEIYVKLFVDDDKQLYKVKDGKKEKIDFVELTIKANDIRQLDFTKDAKFRIILKKYLEEYNYAANFDSGNFGFEEFLMGLEKKVNEEKTGVIFEKKDDFDLLEKDINYFIGLNLDLDKVDINLLIRDYPSESILLVPFLTKDIPYGSKIYLFYCYRYYLFKFLDNNKKEFNSNESVQLAFLWTEMRNISTFLGYYDEIIEFSGEQLDDNKITDGYYLVDKNSVRMILLEAITKDEKLNSKMKTLYNAFNEGLSVMQLLVSKVEKNNYVYFEDKKRYNIELISEKSYKKLIKDILNIDLLEECDDRYITGNHLPAFAYESIEQIEPNILSKYIHVMRIIKKFKSIYKIMSEEKTNEEKLFDFWSQSKFYGLLAKKLKNENFTREDYLLELADDPIGKIIMEEHQIINKENAKFGIFKFYNILSNIMKLDLSSYFDKSIADFHYLFMKYLKNKVYEIGYDEKGNVIIDIYDTFANQKIEDSMLSSGEYKILRLIKDITLDQKKDIKLIDEPELSLSIFWQKSLLNDLLEHTNTNKLIIATQSTNIINENQVDYLTEVKYYE